MTASPAASPALTVFSIPKPFEGRTGVQQRNAIGSWLRLGEDVEVILCGDDAGVADTARDLGVGHLPGIRRNQFGTPLVSWAFAEVSARARGALVCYANADIILMSDFRTALPRVGLEQYLLCGQRWDLDFDEPVAFESPAWERNLRALVERSGKLHNLAAMDYFVYPRGLIPEMPPFVVGRAMWDNWLLFHARARGLAIVDATRAFVAVHQNHDYAHAQGGMQGVWYGPEARQNRVLAADMLYPFTLRDATHELTPHGLRSRNQPSQLARLAMSEVALRLRGRPALRRMVRAALRAKPI